jgi:hypothetical protein
MPPETVAFDQQRAATGAGGRHRRRHTGGTAAEDHDVVFAPDRCLAAGFR